MGAILGTFYKNVPIENPVESKFNTFKRYQLFAICLIGTSKWPTFYHMLSHMIIAPKMTFYCGGEAIKQGDKINYTGAMNKCPCKEKFYWDTNVFQVTTQTKYNIMCETEYLLAQSKTIMYVGLLIGVYIYGAIADKFGRVPSLSLGYLVTGVAGCTVPFMPNIVSFCAMRLIQGIGSGGVVVISYVIVIEYCGPRNRSGISALFHLPLNCAHMTMGVLSYYLRNCDHLMFAISIPCLIYVILVPLFVYESPKWLLDTGDTTKAASVMTKICKIDKRICPNMKSEMDAFVKNRSKSEKKISTWRCFTYKQLVLNFLAMAMVYFTCGFTYYGVSQYISEMSGNIFLNMSISGLTLIPGTLACSIFMSKINRKVFTCICLVGGGVSFLLAIFCPDSMALFRVIIASVSNCLFFMLFIIGFLYGCELFPTSVRSSMLGLMSLISRIGQILAPLILGLKINNIEILFPAVALISALFLYFPPETRGIILPATIEEAIDVSKRKGKGNLKKVKATQT